MKPFEKCPICGGELEQKKFEKLLRGGKHTAVLRINPKFVHIVGDGFVPKILLDILSKLETN